MTPLGDPPTPAVPPARTPPPSQDVGGSVLPVPTPSAHPEGLSGWGVTHVPSPTAPEGAPEEPDSAANGTMAAPTAAATSAPPCPGDGEPTEPCGEPTGEQRAAVAEALVTLALRFYQRMAEAAQPDANLLFSPINVAVGLSHLLLGEGRPAGGGPAVSALSQPGRLAEPPLCLQEPAGRPRSDWPPSWRTRRGWTACTAPCSSWPARQASSRPHRSSTAQVRRAPVGRGPGRAAGLTLTPRRAAPPAALPQRLPALLRRPPARPERQREPGPAAHQRLGAGGQQGAAALAAVGAAPRAQPAAAQRRPPARYGPHRAPAGRGAWAEGLRPPPVPPPGAPRPPAAVPCPHSRLAHAAGP